MLFNIPSFIALSKVYSATTFKSSNPILSVPRTFLLLTPLVPLLFLEYLSNNLGKSSTLLFGLELISSCSLILLAVSYLLKLNFVGNIAYYQGNILQLHLHHCLEVFQFFVRFFYRLPSFRCFS